MKQPVQNRTMQMTLHVSAQTSLLRAIAIVIALDKNARTVSAYYAMIMHS